VTRSRPLPPGWAWVSLGDLLAQPLINGRSVRTQEGGFPVLRLTAIKDGAVDCREAKPGEWDAAAAEPFLVEPGDLLIVRGNGSLDLVGRAGLVPDGAPRVAFPDTAIRARVDRALVDVGYLAHVWSSPLIRQQIQSCARTTAGIYKINQTMLSAVRVPLPPRDEQPRIVAALAEHLSKADVVDASLATLARRLSQLRHAVITEAVGTREVHGGPLKDGWARFTLGDVTKSVRNGVFVSRPGSTPIGTPILRIGAVRQLRLALDDRRWTGLEPDDEKLMTYLLRGGDLLFTRYNGNPEYVGACAEVPALREPLVYPDKLIRVRLDETKALPAFIALACAAGDARSYIRAQVKTTAGQAGIAASALSNIPLVLPPLPEQRRRSEEASRRLSLVAAAAESVVALRRRTAALRRSLLAAAASGALVNQGVGDEPVELLLKRVAETRNQDQPNARRRGARTVRAASAPAGTPVVEESS
jgi:type I restriction enzyme S subunit